MMYHTDTDKENVTSLSLKYEADVYQEYFGLKVIARFSRDGEQGNTGSATATLSGNLDSGTFYPSERYENESELEKIFNIDSIKNTVIEDFKNQERENLKRLKDFLKGGGKKELVDRIKQKAFGHELGGSPTKGKDLAATRYRRLTDE